MKQKIHFISGLGADKRVFSELDLPNVEAIYIDWVAPAPNDSLPDYAEKLLSQIDQSAPVIIVGLSFGGMLAVELSRFLPQAHLILLSTAKSPAAIPKYLKKLGQWKIPDKLPWSAFRHSNAVTNYFFGVQSKEHKKLLQTILLETDETFFRWAIHAILSWENPAIPHHWTQIHGTKDRILPLVKEDEQIIKVEGGGHFMVLAKAKEVGALLNQQLGLV